MSPKTPDNQVMCSELAFNFEFNFWELHGNSVFFLSSAAALYHKPLLISNRYCKLGISELLVTFVSYESQNLFALCLLPDLGSKP
jgi:hypothetical protein